jgi:predicted NBD/HSP70 family sugar kinase
MVRNILVADIGGTHIKFGFSVDGKPHDQVKLFPSNELSSANPIESLAGMSRTVIEETRLVPDQIVSTVPGFIDRDQDLVLFAANLPELNNRRLASEWSRLVGIPVVIERDSILSLIGESLAGACRGAETVLGLFFGTGVGAAFLENGKPFRGGGWALEVGRMPFKSERTKLEGTDCLEAYVSGIVLQAIAEKHSLSIEDLWVMKNQSEHLEQDLDLFIHDQAIAVATTLALFSPQVLLIGGGVCDMKGFPREQLAGLIEASSLFSHLGRTIDLRWATLGWQSVLHGAPEAVREHTRSHSKGGQDLARITPSSV